MVVIPDLNAPVEAVEQAVDHCLREWVGSHVERGPHGWSWSTTHGKLFAVLDIPESAADGSDPEHSLEIIRQLRDLGYSGALRPADASAALASGTELLHARICIGPDPAGSRRQALLLQGTLYLADLQREEFDALLDELHGKRLPLPE